MAHGELPEGLEAQSAQVRQAPAWGRLEAHARELSGKHLRELRHESGRYELLSRKAGPAVLDFSRQRVSAATLPLLLELAGQRSLSQWRASLFAGDCVNSTEQRPALHMALRNRSGRAMPAAGTDVMPLVRQELRHVLELADALGAGEYRGHGGTCITDIVNIGIGGSDLGIVMAIEALRPYGRQGIRAHCVSNIDGTQLADLLPGLDPAATLFIICSKSFTTLETQLNAEAARAWFLKSLPASAIGRHFVAVSVNDTAMDAFGIAPDQRFRIWDWVGGRYSLWSSVGLLIAITVGSRNFEALLDGAAELDEHFRTADFADNLPVLLGLLGVWNQNFLVTASHAVLPYTQRLQRFPAFLQQLEMESNGKSVLRTGAPAACTTGTVVWGEPGSNAQHAFFQLLHQGNANFSADFIAPVTVSGGFPDQHVAGLANMLAQAEAFAYGRTESDVRAELSAAGVAPQEVARLAPHKVHAGNRPASIILLDQLDPRSLGFLIALYEHKVFVQSVVWGINPFDQWGVELGKVLARQLGDALAAGSPGGELPPIGHEIRRRLGR